MGVFASVPRGAHLQIDILSTWGDPHYVGLAALEIFDEHGEPVELEDPSSQVRADPADINVLPEYGHDVRVVSNLFDGTLRTCDDAHLWLAPFTPGRRNLIFVDMGGAVGISMVRVWNYNKNRTHSFRGARLLEMRLDGNLIFRGEVNKAPGVLHEAERAAEPILFTTEASVLSCIEERDSAMFEFEPVAELGQMRERPSTAERAEGRQLGGATSLRPSEEEVPEAVRSALERPRTAAFNAMIASCRGATQHHRNRLGGAGYSAGGGGGGSGGIGSGGGGGGGGDGSSVGGAVPSIRELQDYIVPIHPAGRHLKLQLLSTWGDPHYIGLNGIQLLSPSGQSIRITPQQIVAEPPSIASMPQLANDPRTVDKLVDGTNSSYDDRHMFLAPFTPGRANSVRIDLGRGGERIAAVRIWNYAKTSTRGVRSFELLLDGALLYQGSARPAPPRVGSSLVAASDFVQTVLFTDCEDIIRSEAENVYNSEDIEDGLQIFDNGAKIGGGASVRPEELVRPMTMAMGAAPPTARRGARPVAGGHFGAGTRPVGSAHQQATLAAAQARSAAALRRPVGGGPSR